MVSIYKVENTNITPSDTYLSVEVRGLSTDEKPIEANGKKIANGSVFIEIDTGKIFFYDLDSETWKEV
jgi:hypothetical protein